MNRDGGGGTGRLERVLDINGVLPIGLHLMEKTWRNRSTSKPSGFQDSVIIDKQCFGCQISCHRDVYAASPDGKDPDPKKRKEAGDYVGRYEFEPMELMGPNLGILDPRQTWSLRV